MPYAPQPRSKRSQRRANRGFKSLEVSTRKHRRAMQRLGEKCSWSGKAHAPGEQEKLSVNGSTYTAGGSMRYH